jgi:hypothetical protein
MRSGRDGADGNGAAVDACDRGSASNIHIRADGDRYSDGDACATDGDGDAHGDTDGNAHGDACCAVRA